MYEYGMVKSIHDQRMRQFMVEAERSHLIRQLRKNRRHEPSMGWLASVADLARQMFVRPQPTAMN